MGFTCDVPLNPTAQLVFSLVNQGGAPAFVNMMAVATLVVAGAEAGVFSYLAVQAAGSSILLGSSADGYVALGGALGGKVFTIPDAVWQTMSTAEQWAANQAFLDAAINARATIILGTNPSVARVGSFFWMEIQYLISKGYVPNADGTQMIFQGVP